MLSAYLLNLNQIILDFMDFRVLVISGSSFLIYMYFHQLVGNYHRLLNL